MSIGRLVAFAYLIYMLFAVSLVAHAQTAPEYVWRDLMREAGAQGVLDSRLCAVAHARGLELLASGGLWHLDGDGRLAVWRVLAAHGVEAHYVGENLAMTHAGGVLGEDDIAHAQYELLISPEHRANLEHTWDAYGLAIAGPDARGYYYFVQVFVQY